MTDTELVRADNSARGSQRVKYTEQADRNLFPRAQQEDKAQGGRFSSF
jgi:hypothetical protein